MYDVILSGGTVIDGTRTKPYTADIGIKGGKIVAIKPPNTLNGTKVIDVSGKIVSPGFIDIHTHSDICPLLPKPFYPLSSLFQGVTTQIGGNCGISIVPCYGEFKKETLEYFKSSVAMENDDYTFDLESISDYSDSVKKNPFISNIGILIGHSALRGCIMGFGDRNPTAEELSKLENLLDRELTRGALGMSLGLIYPPSAFSTKDELVALAKVVAEHNGILSVHMRNEGKYVFESVKEMLEIAKLSGVHLQLSHLKLIGKSQWGASKNLLKLINDARDSGINVTCDQYPYHATSTLLNVLAPKWAHDGGNEALIKNLHEKSQKLIDDIAEEMDNRGGGNCVKVVSTQGSATELDGKTIESIAKIRNTTEVDAVIDMMIMCNGSTKAIYFSLCEDDVIEILKDMNIAIGSDGYAFDYNMKSNPHPRSFGTFPRFLRLVRELKLMPTEDAIYKITSLPAKILGISDRGLIKEDYKADITVFDNEKINDTSDFIKSPVKPEGIEHIIINGILSVENGVHTSSYAGEIILKK